MLLLITYCVIFFARDFLFDNYDNLIALILSDLYQSGYISSILFYSGQYQGGESKGKFCMEQAKMTPRKELCESKVSVMSFLPCY